MDQTIRQILELARDNPLVVLTGLLVVFTAIASFAALKAAKATRDGVQTQLFLQLMTEYAREDMFEALRSIGGIPQDWLSTKLDTWAIKAERGDDQTLELNQQRRLLSHFFAKTALVVEEEQLKGRFRDALIELAGTGAPLEKTLDLNRALAAESDTEEKNRKTEALLRRVFQLSAESRGGETPPPPKPAAG